MRKLWYGRLETRNFTFDCLETSEASARALLCTVWEKHKQQTGAAYDWSELEDSCHFREITVGTGYRDEQPLAESHTYSDDYIAKVNQHNVIAVVARIKKELNQLFQDGTVPDDVTSFADVHDYIDGNELGGFCDERVTLDAGSDADADFINEVQGQIDTWLKERAQPLISDQERAEKVADALKDLDIIAEAVNTGGGVYCVVIPASKGCIWQFGMADVQWSGGYFFEDDMAPARDEYPRLASRSDSNDWAKIAKEIADVVGDTVEKFDWMAQMRAVRTELENRLEGQSVTIEYPGYISIAESPIHEWCIGTANGTWGGNFAPTDEARAEVGPGLNAFDTGIPEKSNASVKEIVDAILKGMGHEE